MLDPDEVTELLKGAFPVYVFVIIPLILSMSPSPVAASHEFPVFRMNQFEIHGFSRGCKASSVNLEARSLATWRTSRHCVMCRLGNLTSLSFYKLKEQVGAILIVLPKSTSSVSQEEGEAMNELENHMISDEVEIPVYFAKWSPEVDVILQDVENDVNSHSKETSAWEVLMSSFSANGYQVVINANKPTPQPDPQIISLQGKLTGHGLEEKLPTIIIVAYYDAFGVAPDLSFGADSNGSGVVALLELIRIFSHLYSDPKSHAPVNIVFFLSGGGKYNYQGSKKWLEDQLDGAENSIIQDAQFVLCLDSVSSSKLHFHVSKPPKEGSPLNSFFNDLNAISETPVDMVHKKINLADESLAWEHERFSIRRLPAATLSSFKSHKDPGRGTVLDTVDKIDYKSLAANIRSIAAALSKHVYNFSRPSKALSALTAADEDRIKMWLEYLASHSRSAAIMSEKQNPVIKTVTDVMNRYLIDVKVSNQFPDKRDPEFVFYSPSKSTCFIYNVKPAIFDLLLTLSIVLYLIVVYYVVQNVPLLFGFLVPLQPKRVKVQ